MPHKDSNSNQFTKAGEILLKLKPHVSAQDRKDCMKELSISDTTVTAYLKGKVLDLGTAEKLILFFGAAIERRNKVFNEALASVAGE
jgi:hypothetical protein